MSSAEIREQRVYRICQDCGEVCLCGEIICPNCDSGRIEKERFAPGPMDLAGRIRCRHRFLNLEPTDSHES